MTIPNNLKTVSTSSNKKQIDIINFKSMRAKKRMKKKNKSRKIIFKEEKRMKKMHHPRKGIKIYKNKRFNKINTAI